MKTFKALVRALVVLKAEYPGVENISILRPLEQAISAAALTHAHAQTLKTVAPTSPNWAVNVCEDFAIRHEGKIPAIKAYRARTGLGLLEAKQAIEKYIANNDIPVKVSAW
jgi:ribosomal protein L7/L12